MLANTTQVTPIFKRAEIGINDFEVDDTQAALEPGTPVEASSLLEGNMGEDMFRLRNNPDSYIRVEHTDFYTEVEEASAA